MKQSNLENYFGKKELDLNNKFFNNLFQKQHEYILVNIQQTLIENTI